MMLSPVFTVSRAALVSKFDSAPLFAGHEGPGAREAVAAQRTERAQGSPCMTGRIKTTRNRLRGRTRSG